MGYAMKPMQTSTKSMNSQQKTQEYIKSKASLFVVLNKRQNVTIWFNVQKPQYYISHTTT